MQRTHAQPRIIAVETEFLRSSRTGISNYTINILAEVLRQGAGLQIHGLGLGGWSCLDASFFDAPKTTPIERDLVGRRFGGPALNIRHRLSTYRSFRFAFHLLKGVSYSLTASRHSMDLFHAFNFVPPSIVRAPVLPVVYDLSTFRFPQFHPSDRVRRLGQLNEVIERAPLVQTISEFSRREIVSVFGISPERVFVAAPAASHYYAPLGEAACRQHLAELNVTFGNYFLAVGTFEPRKNLRTLISAFGRLTSLERLRCPLVIAGAHGWGDLALPRAVNSLIAEGSLRLARTVSNPTLRSLYEGARLVIMPSIYEGFGMPIVEAMACGAPVAHSADTAMDEVSGEFGMRVFAEDVDGWTELLRTTIYGGFRLGSRERRIAHARRFDWCSSAAKVIEAYEEILGLT